MSRPFEFASLLLLTSALVSPSAALAQSTSTPPAQPQSAPPEPAPTTEQASEQAAPGVELPAAADQAQQPPEAPPEISVPGGGDIIVTGRRAGAGNIVKSTSQVVSVLSSADIARTGEGDIAGALGRVSGLSVVGNGFVYVRGLGDRYSLALLNGSPLPSPEPLKRVVPLDIFPTNVIASALVQKSYSANFPGEFGGGVINLTTKSVPKEGFFDVSTSIGYDTVTTGQLGYTYYGSASDWTGFDNGARSVPPALANFFASGNTLSQTDNATQRAIASQLVTGNNAVVQRNGAIPPNWGVTLSGGKSWDVGDKTLGLIGTFGYSNKWRTRDVTQQNSLGNLIDTNDNFENVITDNRLVVNGLIGASLDFGRNKIRWTNLYVRDTLKQARYAIGTNFETSPTATLLRQNTAWFQRQLIDSQLTGEFKFGDKISLDVRGGYANTKRNAPSELRFEYFRANDTSPFGNQFINLLNGNRGSATTAYSTLNENLFSVGADLSYKFSPNLTASAGYAWQDSYRRSERREFLFRRTNIDARLAEQGVIIPPSAIDAIASGVGLLRPDYLLSPSVINAFGIELFENTGTPAFGARLRINAAYGRVVWDPTSKLNIDLGVRFEHGFETVNVVQVFNTPLASLDTTSLVRDYWLPGITATYRISNEMQVRISGSKTVSRPQFRELIVQPYYDPESNRSFVGNARLVDSQLYNAEARWEWFYAREQRISVAGFYKHINRPIEVVTSATLNDSYANAPSADLYGAELDLQKYFGLEGVFGDSPLFSSRRAVVIANYTYTKSTVHVGPNDPGALSISPGITLASQLFRDGVPLTGQSDHIVNLELGLDDKNHLSQQTFLISYASKRLTRRSASLNLPDIFEYPGFQLDFVARQGVKMFNVNSELKFEVRNITGTRYRESQSAGGNEIFYNLYNRGTTGSLSLTVKF